MGEKQSKRKVRRLGKATWEAIKVMMCEKALEVSGTLTMLDILASYVAN